MGLKKKQGKGIFCIEGHWDADLRNRATVEPVLRMLHDSTHVEYIHRHASTRPELEYYLSKWRQRRYDFHPVLYLVFHGHPDLIWMPETRRMEEAVTLEQLGDLLEDRCAGRVIHLGSCATLKTHGARLNRLLHQTGALAVCGFTTYMDWITSSAFDLILFYYLQGRAFAPQGIELVLRDVKRCVPGLVKQLGFRMKIQGR